MPTNDGILDYCHNLIAVISLVIYALCHSAEYKIQQIKPNVLRMCLSEISYNWWISKQQTKLLFYGIFLKH